MSDEARRLLAAVKREIDADAHLRCLLCHEEGGHCEGCPAPEIDAFLAQPEPAAREAVLIERLREFSVILAEEVTHGTLSLGFGPDWPAKKVQLAIDRLLIAGTSPAAAALLAAKAALEACRYTRHCGGCENARAALATGEE